MNSFNIIIYNFILTNEEYILVLFKINIINQNKYINLGIELSIFKTNIYVNNNLHDVKILLHMISGLIHVSSISFIQNTFKI